VPIRDISNVPPPPSANQTWWNWARTEEITTQLFRPRSIAEVVKVVVDAGRPTFCRCWL
jgi:hypothetical protein